MNATFLKVLHEVLLGILIMEQNVRRGNKIRRRRRPGTKKVLSQSRLTCLGCHTQFIQEREREREREREHITTNNKEKKRKEKTHA